jgi:type VI protein secretion system component VasK
MRIDIKVKGDGVVTHRCIRCGSLISSDAVLIHEDGRLVAVHREHQENERWQQTRA